MASNHPSGLNLATIPGDHVLESPRLSALRIPHHGSLVLSRLPGERIVLHDGRGHVVAVLTLVEVRGDKARIGIAADHRIEVDREEIYRAKGHGDARG